MCGIRPSRSAQRRAVADSNRARRQLVDAQLAAQVPLFEATVHSQALGAR